jgi:hypothetical protein
MQSASIHLKFFLPTNQGVEMHTYEQQVNETRMHNALVYGYDMPPNKFKISLN